jgi:hypothetical protein
MGRSQLKLKQQLLRHHRLKLGSPRYWEGWLQGKAACFAYWWEPEECCGRVEMVITLRVWPATLSYSIF